MKLKLKINFKLRIFKPSKARLPNFWIHSPWTPRSHSTNSICSSTCSKFSGRPVLKLSKTVISILSFNKASTKWLPMKPAPPVTTIRSGIYVLNFPTHKKPCQSLFWCLSAQLFPTTSPYKVMSPWDARRSTAFPTFSLFSVSSYPFC